MGGKRNKSKKFLRQQHQQRHQKANLNKKEEETATHSMNVIATPSKQSAKQNKKSRQLFNAGINALDEQPEIDTGLFFQKSDAPDPHADFEHDMNDDIGVGGGGIGGGDIGGDESSDTGTYEHDFSDVVSLQSEMTILDDEVLNASNKQHLIDNEIDDLLDDVGGKDGGQRIQALLKLNNALRVRATNEHDLTQQNQRLSVLGKNLATCIRRGSINEQLHALDTIGLVAISLDDALDFWIKYFQVQMKALIQRPKSAVVQLKAMSIWSIMVWSLGESAGKIATLRLLEYFWNYNLQREADSDGVAADESDDESKETTDDADADASPSQSRRASPEILCAALDAWLFLITSIGDTPQIGSLLDEYYTGLLQLLRLESSTVMEKIQIGKALTILIDNYQDALENDPDFDAQDVNIEAVMHEFNHLRSNSKQHKRKEFLVQKTKFRDYLKTLEHKWTPLIVIKLHHKRFEIAGWNKWVQYHAIKQLLLNGLQAHLLQNSKLKEKFNIDINEEFVGISKDEKKNKKYANFEKDKNTKMDRSRRRDKKRGFVFDKTLVE